MITPAARNAAARKRLAGIPGIGKTLAAQLVRRGLTTKAQLRTVIGELPRETQAHLRYNVCRSIPLAIGAAIIAELRIRLTFESPAGRRRRYSTVAVGSVRRGAAWSKDLDVLVVVPGEVSTHGLLASAELKTLAPQKARRARGPAPTLTFVESYASGDRRRSFIVRHAPQGSSCPSYYAVDLFLATEEEKPYALFHFTGPKMYNIRVRAHAKRKGYILNQYGLFIAASRGLQKRRAPGSSAVKTERDLVQFLGVTYRPPKDR